MKEVILIKDGELVLKGLNKKTFEDALVKNLKQKLSHLGEFNIERGQSTIMAEPLEDIDLSDAVDDVSKVFGIAAFSRAAKCKKNINEIKKCAAAYLGDELKSINTFKVESRRSDKAFPLTSPQINSEVGGYLLKKFDNLKVDVHTPDIIVTIEVRENFAFIRGNNIKGAGGIPVGTSGRATVLISGGIDSPVASYMMEKRGLELVAVHFASPPYTSELAELKVIDLLKKISEYGKPITTYIVPFTKLQEAIRDFCPEKYFTLIMRRAMMRISEKIAIIQNCHALITGESLAQVASQTLLSLASTDSVVNMPVFRPCIGMDKEEIISIARKIGTYDISIEPYEDCCTVFTPKHPKTHPTKEGVLDAESTIKNMDNLIDEAVKNARRVLISE